MYFDYNSPQLWFIQWLLRIDPGYTYFTKDKKTGIEAFYIEHAYRSYESCWNRPICSAPGATVDVAIRARVLGIFFLRR